MLTSRDIVRAPVTNPNPTNGLKPRGWHSRRHQTRDAQDKARERWRLAKSPDAKRALAAILRQERALRTTPMQLALIAKRPGQSRREVARLTGKVSRERAR